MPHLNLVNLSMTIRDRFWVALLGCAALFALCFVLNTRHNHFPYFYHPDEPGKVEQILSGDWNLHHPLLLLQTTKLFAHATGTAKSEQALVESGRTVSAIFISAGVVALTLLTWRWRGDAVALAVGLVLATHHQLYELAHYLKEDSALFFGLALTFLAAWLYSERPTIPRAIILGVACALAISGKYLGAVSLAIAVPVLARESQYRRVALPTFVLTLIVFFVAINLPAFTHLTTFRESFTRETELVVKGQAGMTRQIPHAQYWSVFLDNSTPLIWIMLVIFLVARWRHRRSLTFIEIALSAFPFLFAIALSFSPKSNDRYFLPATAMFALLAVIGAGDLSEWLAPRYPRPIVFAGLALALIAGQFPSWTASRPGLIAYDQAFQRDDNQALIDWLNHDVPHQAVIAKDNRVVLPDPERKKHASRLGVIPQTVIAKRYAADLGTYDELMAKGVTHVAVSESDYGKFFLPGLRPQRSEEPDFQRRRDFYDRLFREGELLFERERGTVIYLHPGIRVYRLR